MATKKHKRHKVIKKVTGEIFIFPETIENIFFRVFRVFRGLFSQPAKNLTFL